LTDTVERKELKMVNEQFFSLPEEKRLRIINAGFEVFGLNPYKRASTDLIAAKAEISKGLLFYYFHNKKSLLDYLTEYAERLIKDSVLDMKFFEINDFFELTEYMLNKKYRLLAQSPYIFDFFVQVYYASGDVAEDLHKKAIDTTDLLFDSYFSRLDLTKFKPGIEPREIFQMLIWMATGYMHETRQAGLPISLSDIMEKYRQWSETFKRLSYKEEYLQ
jgi:AcrR family transcriptional regulator